MQAKNYTNPNDRGRFGFSMSGEYRAPYKSEPVFVLLLIGVAAAAGVGLFFFMANFVEKTKREEGAASTFVIIAGVIALALFIAILIAVFGVGIKNVKKGFLCKYSANDETFTATVGGDLHVIRYSEVSNINFEPRSTLGKIRGYDVTIRVNGRDEMFSICSDGYLAPNSTPFFIIQERLDIMRRAKPSAQINTARSDTRAITRAEIDRAKTGSLNAMDRMSQLLGETSSMPELSATPSATERAVAEVERLMNSYQSAGMPSIGEGARPASPNYYIDDMGRQHSMDATQAEGSFYVKPDPLFLILLTAAITVISGVLAFVLINFLIVPLVGLRLKSLGTLLTVIELAVTAAAVLFAFYLSVTRIRGPLHRYKADGRGFFITVKGKGQDQILYKDVLSVDYKRTKLLWGNRGYKVDILTTYGVVHFDYIFPNFNQSIALKNLPFDVIKRNIPNRAEENQQ